MYLPMIAPSAVIKLIHLRASWEPANSEAPPTLEGAGSSGMRRTHGGHSLIGGGRSGNSSSSEREGGRGREGERERGREGEREGEGGREREREGEREREREGGRERERKYLLKSH